MISNIQHLTPIQVVVRLVLLLFITLGLNSCFDSSTEEPPASLRQPAEPEKPKPTATDDTLSVPVDSQGIVDVVDNDSTASGSGSGITIDTYDETSANGGVVVHNGDGTFTYTPPPGFAGEDSFSYVIIDADGNKANATVTIIVSLDVIPNGRTFYAANCAICHAAGSEDLTTAFNATDLSVTVNPLTKDLTIYGGEYALMGAFYNLPQQNVDELKAFLASL